MSIKMVSFAALTCALAAIVVATATASVPAPQSSPPPPCAVFVTGYALTSAHDDCSAAVSDAAFSCAHDKDSTLQETYDDSNCFLRIGSRHA